jgi:uncharacterized protein (TIGR01777 family)
MRVAVAGSSGLLGSALVGHLTRRGHVVRRLVRRPAQAPDEISWDTEGRLDPDDLRGFDAVVNLGGAGLGDRRWTTSYRRTILRSRTAPTGVLARALADADDGPRVLLQASAVGFYGDRGDEVLTEQSGPGEGFLAEVVQAWEAATAPAAGAGVRVAHLRTGIVMSRRGGSFGRLLPLLRLGVGGPLGDGRNVWPWISLLDHARAIEHLLTADVTGPVNLTAPQPAPQRDIIAEIARTLHRPALVRVPRFALRLVLGDFADDVLSSQRAMPRVLTESGFKHVHPDLPHAAAWVTGRPARPR